MYIRTQPLPVGSLQNWQENNAEFTNENETPVVVATALVVVIVTVVVLVVVVIVVVVVVVVVVFLSKAMETLTVQYRDNTIPQ